MKLRLDILYEEELKIEESNVVASINKQCMFKYYFNEYSSAYSYFIQVISKEEYKIE